MTSIEPRHEALPATAATSSHAQAGEPTLTVSSAQLLGERRAVTIEHEGAHYTLRATRNGKLILTK